MSALDDFVRQLDACRKVARDGSEYWMARDIQHALGYERFENFEPVIARAMEACRTSEVNPSHQFLRTQKMITAGKGAQVPRSDYFLSRYACYLIAINGDPSKPEVGYAQTYFTVQTRRQEVQETLTDAERRALSREKVRNANRKLMTAAKAANVQHYAIFQDAGYKGLYGGLGVRDIKRMKGIADSDDLLDCAGRAELVANEFRITQAEQKLERERVKTEAHAVKVHHDVAVQVRRTIANLNNPMPETLPAEPNINKLVSPKRRKELIAAARDEPRLS
jgi:DNA-damage-inducible protein D